ncbi:MAG TPA: hypothetical protein VGQ09_05090 [Chitinophagaceae bacterium]|nr:hypothetical protein [Chitinophagaceae bacterium]
MRLTSNVVAILILMMLSAVGKSQQLTEKQQADDGQRKLMKDSLRISDQAVTQIFSIRQSYFLKSETIRADSSISLQEKQIQLQKLRDDTNNGIKRVLGDALFEKYTQMILRRMNSHYGTTKQPLASGN